MPTLTRLLKISAISLMLTSLAACHPTHVRESYQESYVPAYRPTPAYAPSYSVQYYSPSPVYVERRTVVVPRVVVIPPRVVHSDDHRQRGWDGHVRNQHGDRREGRSGQTNRDGGNTNPVQVIQQHRKEAAQPSHPRDGRRERSFDRKGPRGKDD